MFGSCQLVADSLISLVPSAGTSVILSCCPQHVDLPPVSLLVAPQVVPSTIFDAVGRQRPLPRQWGISFSMKVSATVPGSAEI
jgi:hypothetical protein